MLLGGLKYMNRQTRMEWMTSDLIEFNQAFDTEHGN
jgi:hypothetical protein